MPSEVRPPWRPPRLARNIHDGSLRSTHCNRSAMGPRQSRRETGAWSREGGRRTRAVRRPTEQRARPPACHGGRMQACRSREWGGTRCSLKCNGSNATNRHEYCGLTLQGWPVSGWAGSCGFLPRTRTDPAWPSLEDPGPAGPKDTLLNRGPLGINLQAHGAGIAGPHCQRAQVGWSQRFPFLCLWRRNSRYRRRRFFLGRAAHNIGQLDLPTARRGESGWLFFTDDLGSTGRFEPTPTPDRAANQFE